MFGTSTSSSAGTGAFGSFQQPNQQQQQSNPQPSFGSPVGMSGSSSFPNFGSLSSGQQGQQQNKSVTFGFPSPTGSSTPAGSFGATPTGTSGGFSFGGTASNSTQPGFGFGSTSSNNNNNSANTGFGSFGSSFGGSSGQQQQQPSSFGTFGSSFGGSSGQQQQQPSSFGAFGQTQSLPATNMFGQSQQQQPPQSPMGKVALSIDKIQRAYAPYKDASGRASAGPTAAAVTANEISTTATAPQQPSAQGGFSAAFGSLPAPSTAIAASALTPNDECIFKAVLYDRRATGLAQQENSLTSDSGLTSRQLEQAEINNPDPSKYVPVVLLGIDALQKRSEEQLRQARAQQQHLATLREVVDGIDSSSAQISLRFEALQMKQTQIYQTMLVVLRKLEVLRCRGAPLTEGELRYRNRLHHILNSLKAPYGRIQEIANSLAYQEQQPPDVYSEVYDEEDLQRIYAALQHQRQGLESVTEVLTKDLRDIGIMKAMLSK